MEVSRSQQLVIVRSIGGDDLALRGLVVSKEGIHNEIILREAGVGAVGEQVTLKVTKFCMTQRGMRKRCQNYLVFHI